MGWWVLAGMGAEWIISQFSGSSDQNNNQNNNNNNNNQNNNNNNQNNNNNNNRGGGYGRSRRRGGGYGRSRRRGGGYGRRQRGGYGGRYGGGYGGGGIQTIGWQNARQAQLSQLQNNGNTMQSLGSGIPQTVSDVSANQTQTQQQLDSLNANMNTAFQNKDYAALASNLQQMQTVMDNAHSYQLNQALGMNQLSGQFNGMLPSSGSSTIPSLTNMGGTPQSTITSPNGSNTDPNIVTSPGNTGGTTMQA